ncbi:MAG: hypothetical protein JW829_03765 [Pirellulales bacterium]|nr:hypothetical protein [Pirellulales bacterium]
MQPAAVQQFVKLGLLIETMALAVICGFGFDPGRTLAEDTTKAQERSVLVSSRKSHRNNLIQPGESESPKRTQDPNEPAEPVPANTALEEPTPAVPSSDVSFPAESILAEPTLAEPTPAEPTPAEPIPTELQPIESSGTDPGPNTSRPILEQVPYTVELPRPPRSVPNQPQLLDRSIAALLEPTDLPKAKTANFHGVEPGATTVGELLAAWGDPKSTTEDGNSKTLHYHLDPFEEIVVHATSEVVTDIQIELKKLFDPSMLSKQLHLDEFRSVVVRDAAGEPLGVAYPERGVLMTLTPSQDRSRVSHVLLEPIDAETFLLRAEANLHGPYLWNIRDLRMAQQLDPDSARPHWLLADIYLAIGQPTRAEIEAAAAVAMDPENTAYRLRWAHAMEALGRYKQATIETKSLLEKDPPPDVQAQAIAQLARIAALGSSDNAERAIALFTQAIAIADQLALSRDVRERHVAKELLVDCHLAVAEQIANGAWQQKPRVVPQWIGRASAFAEEMIENDGGSLELRLRVAEHALAALSNFQPMPNPSGWIQEAQQTANQLLKGTEDELQKQRIRWHLGIAYFHALHIAHVLGDAPTAHKYGQLALSNMGAGALSRQALPASEHLVGRLYFRIGAVYAIHENDHKKAMAWYDKAAPLLSKQVPVSPLADPRRHGDALVSMGVSYWKSNKKAEGLKLTELGSNILDQAIRNGLIEASDLTVAYSNLASMHKALGHEIEATEYQELARGNPPHGSETRRK